jgi:hypothetical protein
MNSFNETTNKKNKEKLQAKMSKIISVEKTKILKHVEEINSLKVDNMKLIGQLQEQQSAMTKMSEQIKTNLKINGKAK